MLRTRLLRSTDQGHHFGSINGCRLGSIRTALGAIPSSILLGVIICLVVAVTQTACLTAAGDKYRDPLARNTYPQFKSDTCKAIAEAIWQGDTLRVAQLLASKPELATLVCGEWRVTPLHLAVLCKEAVIVRQLINAGADVHLHDRSRKSALYYATWIENNCEILQYLIESGGDPNRKEIPVGPRYTPFLFAVSMRHSNVPCMLSAGAKIQVEGHPELNAIALALWKYDFALAKFLIQHPLADVDAPALDASRKDTVTIDWYLLYIPEHTDPPIPEHIDPLYRSMLTPPIGVSA